MAALATQLYIPYQLLQSNPFHGSWLPKSFAVFFSYPQSPVNTISFPEDLTLFFGVRTPEQEAKGRKDVFPRVAFGSEKFHWGRKKG